VDRRRDCGPKLTVKRSIRLLILTQYYPPETGAPQARLSVLARCFRQRGHEVTILTGMPNYPSGRIFPGYGGAWMRDEHDGIPLIRTFLYPTKRPGFVPRLANYFSFALSSAILGSFTAPRVDYVLVESPPLFLGLTGLLLSWLRRARLIFNVSDLWPESVALLGLVSRDGVSFRLSKALELGLYRRAWLVTGQSHSIVDNIGTRLPGTHLYHLSNGADISLFLFPNGGPGPHRAAIGADGRFVVLYAGLHGVAQGLDQVLDAADRMEERDAYRFVFLGDGPMKQDLVAEATRRGMGHVQFLPACGHAEVPGWLASSDAVVIPLCGPLPGAVPSKVYEAMASARPIVLVATGEAAEIVRHAGAGLTVPPGNPAEIARAIEFLRSRPAEAKEMGRRGRQAAERLYDRRAISDRFVDYLEERIDQ
jgi:colanic acid biosynthesis glycosyl transferase WcaI